MCSEMALDTFYPLVSVVVHRGGARGVQGPGPLVSRTNEELVQN
jgi:hypothetical protein